MRTRRCTTFFQNDFKANSRLTFNLGLRYEVESPTTERFNHNGRGFDLTSPSPVQAAAQAAYTAHPDAALAGNNFKVPGGVLSADSNHRAFWNTDWTNIEPRVGFAFQAARRVAVRDGWERTWSHTASTACSRRDFTIDAGGFQPGRRLDVPWQSGESVPAGRAQPAGIKRRIGDLSQAIVEFLPLDRKNARTQRFSIGAQVQLPAEFVFEGSYVGNRSRDIRLHECSNPRRHSTCRMYSRALFGP